MKKVLFVFAAVALFSTSAFADRASVLITLPKEMKKGTEAVIKITVNHGDLSPEHFVNLVTVTAAGKEIAKFAFTKDSLPEGKSFVKEVKLQLDAKLFIEAEATCNKHGSAGLAMEQISPK